MDISNSTQAAIAVPTKPKSNYYNCLLFNSKQSFDDLLAEVNQQDPNQSIQKLSHILSDSKKVGVRS